MVWGGDKKVLGLRVRGSMNEERIVMNGLRVME